MDIYIVDALSHIFPCFAAIVAADDPPVLQANMQQGRIFRMNKNMAHVLAVRRPWEGPFFLHFSGQRLNARKLLPVLAAIFAAVQMDGFHADINDFFVSRIDRDGPNVTLKDPPPAHSSVISAIEAILRNAKINDIRFAAQAVDRVDGSGFESNRDIFPRTIFAAPDKQAFLSAGIDTHGSLSCHEYDSLL